MENSDAPQSAGLVTSGRKEYNTILELKKIGHRNINANRTLLSKDTINSNTIYCITISMYSNGYIKIFLYNTPINYISYQYVQNLKLFCGLMKIEKKYQIKL